VCSPDQRDHHRSRHRHAAVRGKLPKFGSIEAGDGRGTHRHAMVMPEGRFIREGHSRGRPGHRQPATASITPQCSTRNGQGRPDRSPASAIIGVRPHPDPRQLGTGRHLSTQGLVAGASRLSTGSPRQRPGQSLYGPTASHLPQRRRHLDGI
jgi:hypothetical protein